MSSDLGGSEINFFVPAPDRWDGDLSVETDEQTKAMILDNVRRALECKGLKVRVAPYVG